jgi:ABC-2 type transport system ATP-binding protein
MIYRNYSLGMKQRLGIAAALLTDPELVMLDEPTNGLDPAGVIEIRKLILRLSALGKTVFLSSHILSEVQQVCNRVAILRKGNLIKQGDVHDLLHQQEQIEIRMNQTAETEHAVRLIQQFKEQGARWITRIHADKNKREQSIIIIDAPADRSAEVNMVLARNNLFAAEVHPREGSLEDIYLQVVQAPAIPGMQPGAESYVSPTTLPEREAMR